MFFKGRATNRIFSLLAALRDWRKHGGVRKGAKKSHKNEKIYIFPLNQASLTSPGESFLETPRTGEVKIGGGHWLLRWRKRML